jgi:Domain of unknown function (DUF1905)/Bacteriocin-protection, YdeI or OmpD-Associated
MEKTDSKSGLISVNQTFTFSSHLENIATGMQYFAISVPEKITKALGTAGPVPVRAKVNNSEEFLASLYPVGQGKHFLRVKNKICKSVNIEQGDKVKVEIVIRDRKAEIDIPADLFKALKKAGVLKTFEGISVGKKSYILRIISEAVKPETRAKRIAEAVQEAKKMSETGK